MPGHDVVVPPSYHLQELFLVVDILVVDPLSVLGVQKHGPLLVELTFLFWLELPCEDREVTTELCRGYLSSSLLISNMLLFHFS